jgi:hypothetical protein
MGIFAANSKAATESTPLPISQTLFMMSGYSQSKWVTEKLLATAKQRGFPIIIIRPVSIDLGLQYSVKTKCSDKVTVKFPMDISVFCLVKTRLKCNCT